MQPRTRTRFALVAALLAGTALGGVGVATGYAQDAVSQTAPTTIQPSGTAHRYPTSPISSATSAQPSSRLPLARKAHRARRVEPASS